MRKKRRGKANAALEKDKFRIIKISKDALWEFIYESIIDNQGHLFDISDATSIVSHHDIDFESGNYICLIRNNENEDGSILRLSERIDLKALLRNMPDTTTSLYQDNRYQEISLEEIEVLQKNNA